jgi:hypothetical protein
MARQFRVAVALALASATVSCGESNPFIGKWELADRNMSLFCMKNLEVTEKSIRSENGTQLYTLVKDGNDYIFDTKEPMKLLARIEKDSAMTLVMGPYKCPLRRVT